MTATQRKDLDMIDMNYWQRQCDPVEECNCRWAEDGLHDSDCLCATRLKNVGGTVRPEYFVKEIPHVNTSTSTRVHDGRYRSND